MSASPVQAAFPNYRSLRDREISDPYSPPAAPDATAGAAVSGASRRGSNPKPFWRWTSSTLPPAGFVDPLTDIPVPELSALTSLLSSLDRRGYSLQPFFNGRWVSENIEHWRLAPRELQPEDWIPPASAGNKLNVMLTAGTTPSQPSAPSARSVSQLVSHQADWHQPSNRIHSGPTQSYQSPPETLDSLHSHYMDSPAPAPGMGAPGHLPAPPTAHPQPQRTQRGASASAPSIPSPFQQPQRSSHYVGDQPDDGAPEPRLRLLVLSYPPSGTFHAPSESARLLNQDGHQELSPTLRPLRSTEKGLRPGSLPHLVSPASYGNEFGSAPATDRGARHLASTIALTSRSTLSLPFAPAAPVPSPPTGFASRRASADRSATSSAASADLAASALRRASRGLRQARSQKRVSLMSARTCASVAGVPWASVSFFSWPK
ncbi:hypothetical protein DFJ73DRAFT_939781 [Zopfochytrium polystomum]|nr:hypothetical protein DFJ73DRAFT_939781 [Zopfochytrium polystomum]